jgi:hypothetical protein
MMVKIKRGPDVGPTMNRNILKSNEAQKFLTYVFVQKVGHTYYQLAVDNMLRNLDRKPQYRFVEQQLVASQFGEFSRYLPQDSGLQLMFRSWVTLPSLTAHHDHKGKKWGPPVNLKFTNARTLLGRWRGGNVGHDGGHAQ